MAWWERLRRPEWGRRTTQPLSTVRRGGGTLGGVLPGGGTPRMDLTQTVPRSPYEVLGGIVFLPRAIDKMRAHLSGTKGEYNSHFGTSERMLRVLFGLTADA